MKAERITLPKQNAGEVAIQTLGILLNFCTFVKLTFFNSRTSLRQIPLGATFTHHIQKKKHNTGVRNPYND